MAEITNFLGISLGFCNDLASPAHVHVNYKHHQCVIGADNFNVSSSKMPPRVVALAVEWMVLNNEQLKRNWDIYKMGGSNLMPIPPLVD
jgi:hypothetical protein